MGQRRKGAQAAMESDVAYLYNNIRRVDGLDDIF
jgi:hypothetical protein